MKIRVPITALEANLNERELLFVNFITQLLHSDIDSLQNVVVDTEFHMYLFDIQKITARYQADPHGVSFENLRNVIRFGIGRNEKYSVSLLAPKLQTKKNGNAGGLKLADYILVNPSSINLYYYLAGITSVKGIVKEFKGLTKLHYNKTVKLNKLVSLNFK